MAINKDEGQFGLDCWIDPKSEKEADEEFFSDSADELRTEAHRLIANGQYKFLQLSHWNEGRQDWDVLEAFEPDGD